MPETVTTIDRPAGAARSAESVSASALAAHLDCSRAHIRKLEGEGVLHRDGSGFPLDQSRVAYLRFLRRERRQSPRSEADTAFTAAKAELLQIRILEKKKMLVPYAEHEAFVETLIGLFLTGLSGFAARCSRDLTVRREIDKAVYDLRVQINEAASRLADERGEPDEPALNNKPKGGA